MFYDEADDLSGITLTTADRTVSIGLNANDHRLVMKCDGPIDIEATGEMKLSGSKITVEADGELVLKGAQIKLN